MTPDQRIARLAADSFGLIRRQDAIGVGLSRHQIGQRVRSGRWETVRPGVYRMAGVPSSPEQALAAATWVTRGVASHRSAGWLLDVGDVPHLPEVTTDRSTSHQHHGLRLHRTTDLLPGTPHRCGGSGAPTPPAPASTWGHDWTLTPSRH